MEPFLDPLGLALAFLLGHADPSLFARPVTFDPRARAVSGWRTEAALHLDASPGTRAALLLGRDPPSITRCVRLDNYWCIKRGGWSGEIAADRDGHVAFASASEGAAVAALLLRRYYVDYGRHSAIAIVSHWAPASCGTAVARPARSLGSATRPAPRPDGLATKGIGSTLRARYLARHGSRVGHLRHSVVPDRLIGASSPAPSIALGLGTAPVVVSATLPDRLAAGAMLPEAKPMPVCAGDNARIQAYALKATAGIAPSITADLALFDANGSPTPNLARLMHNMSAVEIGPLGANEPLVDAAVFRAVEAVSSRGPSSGGPAARSIDKVRRSEP